MTNHWEVPILNMSQFWLGKPMFSHSNQTSPVCDFLRRQKVNVVVAPSVALQNGLQGHLGSGTNGDPGSSKNGRVSWNWNGDLMGFNAISWWFPWNINYEEIACHQFQCLRSSLESVVWVSEYPKMEMKTILTAKIQTYGLEISMLNGKIIENGNFARAILLGECMSCGIGFKARNIINHPSHQLWQLW